MLATLGLFHEPVMAQLDLTNLGTAYTVDFDNAVTNVNNGALESVATTPFIAAGAAAGQLEGNAWSVVLDGADTTLMNASVYPGAGNGGFATLTAPGASSYGWGAWNLSGNHALAMLPSGSWSTPAGTLTLKIINNSGSTVENLVISYYVAAFNDQTRSTGVLFFYSEDNADYIKVPDASFYSSLASTGSWEFATKTINLSGLSIVAGQEFYLRWVFGDHGGGGSRDEMLLDDISITATSGGAPTPTQLAITSVNNGNAPSANEPFSVTVQAQNALGTPTAVTANTPVQLSVVTGTGLLTGTVNGVLENGEHTLVMTGVFYDTEETGVSLNASAAGLASVTSSVFNVMGQADHLAFFNVPSTGTYGENLISLLTPFQVQTLRADNTPDSNYQGTVTLSVFSGPGNLLGTITRPVVAGAASFADLHFNAVGEYVLKAEALALTETYSPIITVTAGASMTELLVPKYIGSKSASSVNNCRTPYAICMSFSNLTPLTSYDMRLSLALVTEALNTFGAGNIWNGTSFVGTNLSNVFTTNADGTTGPLWFYLQPTGNATRFDAGQVHQVRVAVVPNGITMPISPMFAGTHTITPLDIPNVARTTSAADDGAFLKGTVDTTQSGKFFTIYDNVMGTGDPLYCFQVRTTTAFNTVANSDLPSDVDSIWRQLPAGEKGDFAAVIPIGANNPNGIRRVELRNADNTISTYQIDEDGIWPGGANSTTVERRQVIELTADDLPMHTTITGIVVYNNLAQTPMDFTEVILSDMNGTQVASVMTDGTGHYTFENVPLGIYQVKALGYPGVFGGINAIDALNILKHFVGMSVLTGVNLLAGDVSGSVPFMVNSVDALMVQKRFVGMITSFNIGDWVSETHALNITEVTTYTQNIKVLCAGDVNGSFTP